ncbi:MAG: hypothetical protein IJU48_11145 [Synergistaceae bacterium]|nr:hypothetical protein [Synergistaceae bacterium]
MTDSQLLVTNFDDVKTDYMNILGLSEEKAHSVDAIARGKDNLFYMIEFKNGNCKTEAAKINLKIRDSLLILCDMRSKTLKVS